MSAVTSLDRRQFLSFAAIAATSLPFGWARSSRIDLPSEGSLPFLRGATEWINSPALTADNLRGKVVLVDFWTYSCINWRRTLPYLRAWHSKYEAHGLVIIGVHSPEFSFEREIENVRRAAKDMQIEYPIAIDNDYAIWRAFNNEFWPALYFADKDRHIRHHKFGEGEYDKSELVLQQLLANAGTSGFDSGLSSIRADGPELSADWPDLRSQENYLGSARTENFSSGGGHGDKPSTYTSPAELKLNHWALSGTWIVQKEVVRSAAPNGAIAYRFHARDLHLVIGSADEGKQVRFRVLLDGQPPSTSRGTDIDAEGYGVLTQPRMYHLIRQDRPIIDRTFQIEFLDPGAEAYSATFG
jgi:thiol-disulfide isomerase/thioredoxin